MKQGNILWGIVFIALGLLILLSRFFNLHFFNIVNLWPLIILALGLIFEASYFISKKNPGILVPGGILTTIGLLFMFENATNWAFSGKTWPFYPLAVAIGLFQLYIFGEREKGLLIPVGILSGVSLISLSIILFGSLLSSILIPAVLIIIGIYIIFNGMKK